MVPKPVYTFNNLNNNVLSVCVPGALGGGSFFVSEEGSAGLEVIILVSLLGSIVKNRLQKTQINQQIQAETLEPDRNENVSVGPKRSA